VPDIITERDRHLYTEINSTRWHLKT
jgi:hypothetical protein